MILIVSFNARAIAQIAKFLGLEIAVVDFWGDKDLFALTDKVYTVFKPEFKTYHAFPDQTQNEELLVDLALDVLSTEEVEGILIGSGLDDRPDLWEKLGSKAPVLGNTPQCVKSVRDIIEVHKKLHPENIMVPKTIMPPNISNLKNKGIEIAFPIVIKPKKSIGGVGIKMFKKEPEFINFFERTPENFKNYYIQEYIKGENISTTIVGDGTYYKVLSINEQLIGMEKYGTKLPFKYCGNIIPFICSPEVARDIKKVSIYIAKMFQLVGVFGIDFVLQENIPYFMEINPRFPGQIDILFKHTLINPVKFHLDAVRGKLPDNVLTFPYLKQPKFIMKVILFAKQPFTTPIFENTLGKADIPPPNINLKPEDPICTLNNYGKTRKIVMNRVDWTAVQVYSECYGR